MNTIAHTNSLISRLQRNEAGAFSCLYIKYRSFLLNVATDQIGNKLEAQDLVQEFFIEFWEKRLFNKLQVETEPGKEDKALKNFMFRSIRFRCLTHITRKRLNFKPFDGLEGYLSEQLQASPSYAAGYMLDNKELALLWKNAIDNAIARLPPQSAKVFALSISSGHSRIQIAELLGISPHTVKNQLLRATKIIRKKLMESGFYNHAVIHENPF